jgi:hypothetical protein
VLLTSMGFYRANISFSTAALAIDFYRVRGLDKPHAQTREVKKFSGINLALSAFLSALAPHAPQPLGASLARMRGNYVACCTWESY